MNWHWLYEVLEEEMEEGNIVLANPFKTRIIAEAQVKTDKIDAFILAQLLRVNLISSVHIPGKATRQRKAVLRQRSFFVRQRTMLRNRIHRLLGAQHGLMMPQCNDLFGKKGMGILEKLELPAPDGLLL
jgi:transposase